MSLLSKTTSGPSQGTKKNHNLRSKLVNKLLYKWTSELLAATKKTLYNFFIAKKDTKIQEKLFMVMTELYYSMVEEEEQDCPILS